MNMKKLILLISILCIVTVSFGQSEDALPVISTSSDNDLLRVVDPAQGSALMRKSTLLGGLDSTIENHLYDGTNPHLVTKDQIGLGYVENTRLSIWTGSSYLTSLGNVISGIWRSVPIETEYIASSLLDKRVNGVYLNATGSADLYLNMTGGYSTPPGANYTFSNGITLTDTSVTLGGTLDNSVTLNAASSSVGLEFQGVELDGNDYGFFTLRNGAASIGHYHPPWSQSAFVASSLGGLYITDVVNEEGAYYLDDYSVNGVINHGDRHIPDVGLVADMIAAGGGGSYIFGSGLTESNDTIRLGGSLIGETTLTSTDSSEFKIINTDGSYSYTWFTQNQNEINLYAINSPYTSSIYTLVTSDNAKWELSSSNATTTKAITGDLVNEEGIIVTESADQIGLVYAADYSANYTARSLPDSAHVAAMIATGGGSSNYVEVSYTSCTYNDTTYINIGTTSSDVSFEVYYIAERNIGTVQKQAGKIEVLYDDGPATIAYGATSYIGPDLGLTLAADVDGTDIRLMVIVDNSYSNNLSFDETIIHKFYE